MSPRKSSSGRRGAKCLKSTQNRSRRVDAAAGLQLVDAAAGTIQSGRGHERSIVALLVGAVLALAVGLFATGVGLDRDRAFYPTAAIVIASLYALFAVMGGSMTALVLECAVGAAFIAVAVAGFKTSLWLVVLALAAHGVFDFVHGGLIANPGVPAWWPPFCLAYDVTAAAYLAALLKLNRIRPAG
jgi:hypothetical protein